MAIQTNNSSVVGAFLDYVLDKANISLNASLEEEVNSTTCSNRSVNPRSSSARQKDTGLTIRILLYSLIFLLSVLGNVLIIVVLALNKRMRTVTNSFLLSLAVSDLMMAVFCMPFTLIPSILQDFIFGAAMCKIFTYFMGISVSISTFSLVAIAIERYSAICNPLKSRSWQTRSHAYRVIAVTWALSLIIMVPYPVFYVIKTSVRKSDNTTIHMCRPEWPSVWAEQTWYVLLLFTLFFVPGVMMMIAYGLISRELYRGIQFELSLNAETAGVKNGGSKSVSAGGHDDSDGCYVQVSKRTPSPATELRTLSASTAPAAGGTERARSNTSEAKLRAKKRVVRMLMVIVALFFICWTPLYAANTWKAFDLLSAHRALGGAPISFIQLLAYTSACVNPVIYCFMNTRFRAALLAMFNACCCGGVRLCRRGGGLWPGHGRRRGDGEGGGDECLTAASSMATSMSKFSYTTVSTTGPC